MDQSWSKCVRAKRTIWGRFCPKGRKWGRFAQKDGSMGLHPLKIADFCKIDFFLTIFVKLPFFRIFGENQVRKLGVTSLVVFTSPRSHLYFSQNRLMEMWRDLSEHVVLVDHSGPHRMPLLAHKAPHVDRLRGHVREGHELGFGARLSSRFSVPSRRRRPDPFRVRWRTPIQRNKIKKI